ncbi:hypothetical protein RND81_12G020600 [Saponaria officinalis]|uniref:Uncharacterized protein n=1 Tax=Saponaria officinalis TaxID=3572 RepID=A0AAW1H4Y0_SAPOF
MLLSSSAVSNSYSYMVMVQTWPSTFCGQVVDIKSDLDKNWPNLKNVKDNEGFWAHERKEHGSCMTSVLDMPRYFKKALQWNKAFNILDILKKHGFNPGGSYSTDKIKKTIETELKFDVLLSGANSLTKYYLLEAAFCIDRLGNQLISCAAEGFDTSRDRKCKTPTIIITP